MSGVARFEPDFGLEVRPSGADRRVVIEVRGELDSGTCDELVDAVTSCLSGGAPELTLDLARMTFIDSAGTRALIIIERLAREQGTSLVVKAPPEHVTELLRTAGVADRVGLDAQGPEGAAAPSEFTERIELEFPRDPHSPARARAEVRESLHGREQSELATLVLLTSELVTNAVVHPRGVGDTPVMLRVMLYADRVRVEVEDCGAGFDRVTTVGPEAERGRGLFLVDQFSDRWGSGRIQTEVGPRFRVWFELDGRDEGTRAVA
jgi:anti-sigma B factor antagonist